MRFPLKTSWYLQVAVEGTNSMPELYEDVGDTLTDYLFPEDGIQPLPPNVVDLNTSRHLSP